MYVAMYLIQSAVILALFFLVYQAGLRRTTFYRHNRYFLLGALILSAVLPLLPVPSMQAGNTVAIFNYLEGGNNAGGPTLPGQVHGTGGSTVLFLAWLPLAIVVYCLVALFLLVRQLVQVRRIFSLAGLGTAFFRGRYRYLQIKGLPAPFSFGRTVYYDPEAHDEATLQHILDHETAHVAQGHTFDLLFAAFYCSIFWINPFSYLTRRAMQLNLEFLADEAALSLAGSPTAYQYSLLKQAATRNQASLIHHFSQSFIKNRIVMMNQKPSVTAQRLRYALVLPALALGIGLISATKAPETRYAENSLKSLNDHRKDSSIIERRFPEGKSGYARQISRNCLYPSNARNENKWGVVEVEYTVQPDGSITDAKTVKNETGAESLGNELLRQVKLLPGFKADNNAKAETVKLSALFFLDGVSKKDNSIKTDVTIVAYAN